MTKIIFVTGVTDVFGAVIAHALADAGHTVYVGTSQADRSEAAVGNVDESLPQPSRRLRTVALETIDQQSVSAAVDQIDAEAGPIDVVIHTAGPAMLGPAESFTPFQLSELYDINVLSTQRVNRAVLPKMRERREGLLIWTGPSVEPDATPFLAPFHSVRAALDHLAQSYAAELAPFGIDVTVITYERGDSDASPVPVRPGDSDRVEAYQQLMADAREGAKGRVESSAASTQDAGGAVVRIVDAPKGTRPRSLAVGPSPAPEVIPRGGA